MICTHRSFCFRAPKAAGAAGFTLQELSALAGDRQQAGQNGLGADDETGANGEDGVNANGERKDDTDDEDKEKTKDKTAEPKNSAEATKREAATAAAARGKKDSGGILKHGLQKHRHTLLSPDRAHAIAMAEAAVKNASAAAAAAGVGTRLDVLAAATIGLHQSRQAAHSDSSGTPMSMTRMTSPLISIASDYLSTDFLSFE